MEGNIVLPFRVYVGNCFSIPRSLILLTSCGIPWTFFFYVLFTLLRIIRAIVTVMTSNYILIIFFMII